MARTRGYDQDERREADEGGPDSERSAHDAGPAYDAGGAHDAGPTREAGGARDAEGPHRSRSSRRTSGSRAPDGSGDPRPPTGSRAPGGSHDPRPPRGSHSPRPPTGSGDPRLPRGSRDSLDPRAGRDPRDPGPPYGRGESAGIRYREEDYRPVPSRVRAWPDGRHWGEDGRGRGAWQRGRIVALCAVALGLLPVLHPLVPDARGLGSSLETFLPWLGLLVLPVLACAWRRRSAFAVLALLVPVGAWGGMTGGAAAFAFATGQEHSFGVVQHNIADDNPDPTGAVRTLAATGPGLIALQEVTAGAAAKIDRELAAAYPHHAVRGTVGLWSRYPLSDVRPVDIKPKGITEPWQRALRATALTPRGFVAVYVVHLPSVRAAWPQGLKTGWRDEAARRLGEVLAAETVDRVILLGDLNGSADDRGLDPVASRFDDTGRGFGFSWPRSFPVVRLDHVMVRGGEIVRFGTTATTGSDHVPVLAGVRF
ncbi:endonuclease/exonuclease/phosphatase family protein [Streptomyces sp. CA-294286]|uniref:endonuclease/exonuclease/phosphatase family protein n=1 Tax=Streptomyces sp. CA-294286 TaxID=3240070 RepID=UPI003D8B555F